MTHTAGASEWIDAPKLPPLEGDEPFIGAGGATVLDFWRFAMSDLRTNNTRGYLAEFLVARSLGVVAERVEWDDFDVLWEGVKIEVKSSAYLQSWPQRRLSQIKFTNLRGREWGDITAGLAAEKTYKADVYVLSVHTIQHHDNYNPLDVAAWQFYILPRSTLVGLNVDSLTLPTVARLTNPIPYNGLADAIRTAAPRPAPQYWKRETASSLAYFKLVGSTEYILRNDAWETYDQYESGPTWWNITGEIGTDIINADELPPGAPR
ncbi:hypothetical protein K0817_013930 [Microbacterium sp. HD4P20]|uniref:hypothetical protein n=1 Tax=Microbacterium sp. HD4P20 TaxID=2864874 RepID=UPI001C644D31|nr:hypothetical protein [Microbacterium sp. HD4P20]MCP2637654.1 hypothetical protein [Microbacterium sp. HD4P20]